MKHRQNHNDDFILFSAMDFSVWKFEGTAKPCLGVPYPSLLTGAELDETSHPPKAHHLGV
jgi:hypothetical protein